MKTFVSIIAAALLLVTGCASPSTEELLPAPPPAPEQDAGTTGCYPSEPGVKMACETGCGELYRAYQRSGGADAGLYFDYTQCLNECGCDQWPDAGAQEEQ